MNTKQTFSALAILFVIIGCVLNYRDVDGGDIFITMGVAILAIKLFITVVKIPQNSKGTPLELGTPPGKIRFIIKH